MSSSSIWNYSKADLIIKDCEVDSGITDFRWGGSEHSNHCSASGFSRRSSGPLSERAGAGGGAGPSSGEGQQASRQGVRLLPPAPPAAPGRAELEREAGAGGGGAGATGQAQAGRSTRPPQEQEPEAGRAGQGFCLQHSTPTHRGQPRGV